MDLGASYDDDLLAGARQRTPALADLTSLGADESRAQAHRCAATSDYWSSATTNKSDSPSARQRQCAGRAPAGSLVPLLAPADDYYLDVAGVQPEPAGWQPPAPDQGHQLAPVQWRQAEDDYDDYAVPADESCCRLDRSQVELVQLIGEGQKGYVFLGKLQSRDGLHMVDVAIKTLKYETEQLIERLMSEAAMMRQLEHPHIIKFIGVCPETPALIAMELAKFGEVKSYLKLNRAAISLSQLVLFTFQISTALSYLESKHYVHRDVAARNVLVCSHNCVKLADFGLTRNLQPNLVLFSQQHERATVGRLEEEPDESSHYVAAPRVKLPVRWLAPESLVFRRFTSASDVWMFAVCSWELFHFGQLRPWAQLRNNQVLAAIESGQRLARPPNCPARLYQLMLQCWSYAPVQRPRFREIKQCVWSIYLNERAREQLELERLERAERQQRQARLLARHHHQQTLLLEPVGASGSPVAGASYQRAQTGYPARPATQHSNATNGAGPAAAGSPARPRPGTADERQLLGAQMSRFRRPNVAHLLQRQRSQGAIPAGPACQRPAAGGALDDGALLARQRAARLRPVQVAESDADDDDDDSSGAEQAAGHGPRAPLAGAYEGVGGGAGPASWRSSQQQRQQAARPSPSPGPGRRQPEPRPGGPARDGASGELAHDQLGQVLRALRITPTKANAPGPPVQTVRVLSRQGRQAPAPAQAEARAPSGGPHRVMPAADEAEQQGRARQLQLHRRLLGRIRPASGDQAQVHASNKVETVDQSLRILESLMSGQPGGPQEERLLFEGQWRAGNKLAAPAARRH